MTDARAMELREFDTDTGEFEAVAVTYDRIDQHGTRFLPGVFAESLDTKLPPVFFNHIKGKGRLVADIVDYRDTPQQLEVIGQLRPRSTGDFVRRAWEGLRSRVLQDFSVAFTRQETRTAADGVTEFVKAVLHSVDIVLDGSVPGARLMSFRNAQQIGPVAARLAAAERGDSGLYLPSTAALVREADEALDRLDGG